MQPSRSGTVAVPVVAGSGSEGLLRLAALSLFLSGLLGRGRALLEQGLGGALGGLGFLLGLGQGPGGDRLASGLALCLVRRAGDVDRDMGRDLGMKSDAKLMHAEHLDRPVEQNLAPLDGEAAFGDDSGDVAGRDRAVELA